MSLTGSRFAPAEEMIHGVLVPLPNHSVHNNQGIAGYGSERAHSTSLPVPFQADALSRRIAFRCGELRMSSAHEDGNETICH